MKKITKLVLNKSMISDLSKKEMYQFKGGVIISSEGSTCYGCPSDWCTTRLNCPDTDAHQGDCITNDYEVNSCESCH